MNTNCEIYELWLQIVRFMNDDYKLWELWIMITECEIYELWLQIVRFMNYEYEFSTSKL